MKRILYILCSILLLTGGLSAQAKKKPADPGKDMREKVRAEKRAFLMRELALTAGEVDALMPVLNELDDKRFALWRSTETLGRRVRQGDKTLTEAELNTFLEQMLDFHVREAELERTYYLRCRSTLPADKLVRLPMVCKDFARRFFERHKREPPPRSLLINIEKLAPICGCQLFCARVQAVHLPHRMVRAYMRLLRQSPALYLFC